MGEGLVTDWDGWLWAHAGCDGPLTAPATVVRDPALSYHSQFLHPISLSSLLSGEPSCLPTQSGCVAITAFQVV